MEGKAIFYIAAIVGGIGALLLVILLPMSFAGIEYYEVSSTIWHPWPPDSVEKTEYQTITYGIHAKALQWFSSYLSGRQQSVTTGSIFSKPVPLQSGVPQGSVLGPILFTLYTRPLSNTIQKHQFDYHKYADDTKLQKASLPSDFSQISRETEVCVADMKDWMNKNKLKLSEEKTELLAVGDHTRLCQVKKEPLTFGPNAVPFQTSAKNLGVHLDETLSMKEQATSLCRSSYFHLAR